MKKNLKRIALSFFVIIFVAFPAFAEKNAVDPPQSPPPTSVVGDTKKEKISVDYRDTDLSTILRSLSYTYGLNLVASSEVKGKVTISLKDVTIDEALEAILSSQGLVYSRKGSVVYVTAAGAEESVTMATEPMFLKYLKAADAQNLLRKSLSAKGDIKVDDVTNSILVTDFPANIEKVKALLTKIDNAPDQVLIEAKLVDITTKDFRNLGLTWSADYKPTGIAKGLFNRSTLSQEELKSTLTLAGTSSNISGGQFKLDTLTLKNLTATSTLDALIQNQKAHLLASPAIAVLNNQEARIVIGEKVPYKSRTQTTTGTTETTQFIDVGTTLRVTPSINSDGYITMRIHPEVSSVSTLLDAGPRITTREADTTVRIKEGETIVIAGLIKQENNATRSKIPVIGQVPMLDYLFGSRSSDKSQTELAVFITPRIMHSKDQMEKMSKTQAEEAEGVETLPTTGKLNVVMTLFEKADHLQRGTGYESLNKPDWFRMSQAINIYEHIASEFPDSPQAPESLWRIAQIKATFYQDIDSANEIVSRLIAKYPKSQQAAKAKDLALLMENESTIVEKTAAAEKGETKAAAKAIEKPVEAKPQPQKSPETAVVVTPVSKDHSNLKVEVSKGELAPAKNSAEEASLAEQEKISPVLQEFLKKQKAEQ